MAEAAGGGPPLPEDLVIWEILTRLPAKSVLRCRAVCRSWRRRLTSDAGFLLTHHHRQPSLPLVTSCDADTHERRAESFQNLLSPVDDGEMFQMNSGALGLYHYHDGTVDLWVLQDHRSWSWSMNHRNKLDISFFALLPVLDPEGHVLVVSTREGNTSTPWEHLWHISGANGSLLARYEWSAYLNLSGYRFQESLYHHDFFLMEGNAGVVDEKPLFDGLSTVALVRDDNSEPH